jgi:hypothetical protein
MNEKKESYPVVEYGCHCELEEGMAPDQCVIDLGHPMDCRISAAGLDKKEDCKYWLPTCKTAR